MNVKDLLIVFFSLFDVVSGAILALSYGFLMLPSAIGYAVGALGSVITGSVTPVSFMYESMVLSWGQSKDFKDRISMILYAALLTGILGLLGLPQLIVNSIGQEIFLGMLAGVGLYLAKVGLEIAFQRKIIGIPCLIVAILTQLIKNDLIVTVSVSIPFGILLNYLLQKFTKQTGQKVPAIKIPVYKSWFAMVRAELKLILPKMNKKVFIGTLALSTLTIGGNIAYTAANTQISHTVATYNQSTVISSLADFASSLFGGANMELIVTPTASAPHPILAGILFMAFAAFILATGLVHKIARFVPISAMGGYLFVIGALLILPYNAADAFKAGNAVVVALTMAFTVFTNPFYGIVAGVLAKFVLHV